MVPKHVGNGRGGTGLLAYLLHDAVSADARHPATSDRVAWTATSGSPSDDVRLTMRIMQGLVADAPILKRRSGCSLRGRHATNPYAHLVVSWPADQRPDREQQVAAVASALRSQGLEDHLAILVAHDDQAHHHVHVIGCRVHPETGRTNAMSYSGHKLSAWAEKYERQHGGIVIPARVERSRQRAEFRTAVDEQMRDFEPASLSPTVQDQERDAARQTAATQVRKSGQYRLSPTQKPRGPGRRPSTSAERRAWRTCLATQDGSDPRAERAERVALRAQLDAERAKRAEREAAQAHEKARRARRRQSPSPAVSWGR